VGQVLERERMEPERATRRAQRVDVVDADDVEPA
jgi:hypothetical protein